MNTKHEEDFNTDLGRRLALLRTRSKMSQQHLGGMLGVRYQQIHKYETGENRMSPKRIQACAKIFDVPIGYFYGETVNHDVKDNNLENTAILASAEIEDLPEDIRKGFYFLSRQISKTISKDKKKIKTKKQPDSLYLVK